MPVVPIRSRPKGNSLRPQRPHISPTFLAMAAAQMSMEARQPLPQAQPQTSAPPSDSAAAFASTQPPASNA